MKKELQSRLSLSEAVLRIPHVYKRGEALGCPYTYTKLCFYFLAHRRCAVLRQRKCAPISVDDRQRTRSEDGGAARTPPGRRVRLFSSRSCPESCCSPLLYSICTLLGVRLVVRGGWFHVGDILTWRSTRGRHLQGDNTPRLSSSESPID